MTHSPPLDPDDEATYEWQMSVEGFGESGQRKLKGATVLVSRIGGVGGAAAYQLAAAGVGRLILAHAGNIRPGDLNRQLLMSHDQIGQPRVQVAARRLRQLNPRLDIVTVHENVSEQNAADLIARADVVIDAAPLFAERFAMNDAAVRLGKPVVEAAMYEMEAHLTTIVPGRSPCLRCMYGEEPTYWTRRFPVFGAVAGTVGCLAAVEAIKLIAGLGDPLIGRLLKLDLRHMTTQVVKVARDPACVVCGSTPPP